MLRKALRISQESATSLDISRNNEIRSPTREELLAQEFDPNMDSIQAIVDDLSHAELELARGSYPKGEDLEELFNVYQDIWGESRISVTPKEALPSSGDLHQRLTSC